MPQGEESLDSQRQVGETTTHSCLEAESPILLTCFHYPLFPINRKINFPTLIFFLTNHLIIFEPDASFLALNP